MLYLAFLRFYLFMSTKLLKFLEYDALFGQKSLFFRAI